MFYSRRQHTNRHAQRSQSLVEFALSLLPLTILLSGLLDLGRIYFVYTAVADAAGEGALFLSTDPLCFKQSPRWLSGVQGGCEDPKNVQYRMRAAGGKLVELNNSDLRIEYLNSANDCVYYTSALAGSDLPDTTLQLDTVKSPGPYPPDPAAPCDPGSDYLYATQDQVSVQLTQHFVLLTPFIPRIAGTGTLPLNVIATQTITVR